MLARCGNKKNNRYSVYGGANPPVKVCARWRGPNGFRNFKADLGDRLPGTSLGRFFDRGWYRPGNVKFMTQAEQTAERLKKFVLKKAESEITAKAA
jgi:hypothetical protein